MMQRQTTRREPGGGVDRCDYVADSGDPLICELHAAAQGLGLDLDDLALLANWKHAVLARISDAQDRFETVGLHPMEEANLIAEVAAFVDACGRARQ
jgi:hypothetical protein